MKPHHILLGLFLSQTAIAQDTVKRNAGEMHRLHRDAKAYIAMLEDPKRDAYQKPDQVVSALGLKEGEIIADVGAGSGYFAFRFARRVGESGKVYAVDINPEMIRHMNHRVRDLEMRNVVTVLADPDDPLIPEAAVDRFFICDTWHHIEQPDRYLELMKGLLKPGGQIVMVDFQKRELPLGPPLEMKIARADLIRQLEAHGFQLLEEHTFLPYQYFLVFAR
ncbi:MAG: class I SAM-dependent methyltransferase [Acidobacteriota bacterium]